MADITKVMVVEIGNIAKLGPKEKSVVEKLGPKDKPAAGPTCTILVLGNGPNGSKACGNRYKTDHYYDETNDILYTDSCGGTEATYGFYSNGVNYREYSASGLSAPIGSCRSDRRLKHNILFKEYSESDIPIYEFEYINKSDGIGTYVGTMAQDLIKLGMHDAVTLDADGYYSVHYNKIDVPFFKV